MSRRSIAGGVAVVSASLAWVLLSITGPAGALAGPEGQGGRACDIGSLPAAYALHGSGFVFDRPFTMIGRVVFEPDGTLSGENTEIYEGSVDRTTYHGTWSLGSSCRGTVEFIEKHENPATPNVHRADFVVAADGQRAFVTLTHNSYQQMPEHPLPLDTITISAVAERM